MKKKLCVAYGLLRQQPRRRGDRAADEVAFGKGQRVVVRIEDVGAEESKRIRRQRMRHPRHHPDAPAAVVGVEPAGVAEVDDVRDR